MYDAKNRSTIGLGIKKTNFDFLGVRLKKINGLMNSVFESRDSRHPMGVAAYFHKFRKVQ